MDATGDLEITEYDAMSKELQDDLFGVDGSSDPFQAKPKIPRTPDSLASNRSRPVSGDVPLPTRSVSPPVPKPSSRGQDPVKCFYDCLQACRNLKKRHFHCKICDYISERLDNMKRHIPYHFMKLKKERQRAPDGIKMVCHEYFTETCSSDDCSYSKKSYAHLHCTLCKSWACNIKKSYQYRLKHLNRSHLMFFTENENPKEILNDENLSKKINKLSRPDEVKLMTYPAAEVDVLHSRRRKGNKQKTEHQRSEKDPVVNDRCSVHDENDDDQKTVNIEYFKSVGNDVRDIIQPIDTATSEQEESSSPKNDSTRKECYDLSLETNAENDLLDSKEKESTFSVTLNGDLNTILAVLMSVKKNGIVLKDPSLREIISRHPSCSANELIRSLSFISNSNTNKGGSECNTEQEGNSKGSSSPNGSSFSDEGFSETNRFPDLSGLIAEDFMMPLDEVSGTKGLTMETDKILGYLSKMVGIDVELNPVSFPSDVGKDTSMIWGESCSENNTDYINYNETNIIIDNTQFSVHENCGTRKLRSSKVPRSRGKGADSGAKSKAAAPGRRKRGALGPNRGARKNSRKNKEQNVILESTEVVETSQNKPFVLQTIDIENDILINNDNHETISIYDIINGCLRNDDMQDVNCNNI